MKTSLAALLVFSLSGCEAPQQPVRSAAFTPATYFCGIYYTRDIIASRLFNVKTHRLTPVTLRTKPNSFWVSAMGVNRLTYGIRLTPGGRFRAGQHFYINFGTRDDHKLTIAQIVDKLAQGYVHIRFSECKY